MGGLERSFLLLGVGIIAGGAVGAYATTLVYGSHDPETPPRTAACPVCAPCPPPPDCPAIAGEFDEGGDLRESDAIDLDLEGSGAPGLPASAIGLAGEALRRELAPCLASAGDAHGMVLLDLVVTATSGIGRIRHATIAQSEGEIVGVPECLIEATRRVQFEWNAADGETKLRYPIELRAH